MTLPSVLLLVPNDWGTHVPGTNGTTRQMAATVVGTGQYCASGIRCVGGATTESYEHDISALTLSEGWIALTPYGDASAEYTFFELKGATTTLLRGRTLNTSEHWYFDYWDGAAYTKIGGNITYPTLKTGGVRIDIHFNIADSGGFFRIYQNGGLVASFEGDTLTTADTVADAIKVAAPHASNIMAFAAVMVDANDTRYLHVADNTSLSTGFHNEYTGSETSIDNNLGSASTAFNVVFDANGERGTFNMSNVHSDLDGGTVEAVYYGICAKAVADPGLYFEGLCRIGSTDYVSADDFQPVAGFDNHGLMSFPNDPSTAVPWANVAAVNAAQWGLQAVTTP